MENQPAPMVSGPKMMPIEELFRKSFSLYYPKAFTMLFLMLIGWLACVAVAIVFGGIAAVLIFQDVFMLQLIGVLVGLVGVLAAISFELWIATAMVFMVKEREGQVDIKKLLLSVKDKVGSYFWAMLLKGLMVLGGFILLVVPGIIFSVWFLLAKYAFVVEGKKGLQASWRSKELVKGYWWPVVGRLLVFGVLAMLISFIPRVGQFINMLFVVPFGIFYMYAIYEDLKKIKG
ncbi:hypothetical protein KW786_03145 [Candidatus Parcubacteria bacterium]|nr:hypothetical protein [Candidatus Parcubacteria bacterium]